MPCRAEFNTRMLSNNNHGKHLKNSFKFDKHIFKGQHEELVCFFSTAQSNCQRVLATPVARTNMETEKFLLISFATESSGFINHG